MKLQLITLAGEKLNRDVYEVQIPTSDGEISVFEGHQPLVTIAEAGVLMVRYQKSDRDDAQEVFAINGGAVQILPTEIKVLVDDAEHADDIVAEEAESALERAREQRANAKDAISISEAEALMNRAAIRLRVAGLRRRHK